MIELQEKDYFHDGEEMHYARLLSTDHIGKRPHTHQFFEIFLLDAGKITHIVNGQQFELAEGALTFIRPGDAHHFWPIPEHECQLINLAIAGQAVSDLFAYLGEGFHAQRMMQMPLPPTVVLAPQNKQQVRAKLERLNRISPHEIQERRTALRMLLFELVTQYFPLTLQPEKMAGPAWLHAVCEEMQKLENLAAGVPRMVALANVSPEHLARTMRKYMQKSPTNYVNQMRLTYAANLLQHGDGEIVDIAAEVGFESLSYFYQLFKQQYQQTPRQFRLQGLKSVPHANL